MEHDRGDDAVERAIVIRQHVGEAAIELHGERLVGKLAPRALERFRVRIEADDLDLWMLAFGQDRDVAGAAADLEQALLGMKVCLIDQLLIRPTAEEQFLKGIVQRQQPVISSRRNERPMSLAHAIRPHSGRPRFLAFDEFCGAATTPRRRGLFAWVWVNPSADSENSSLPPPPETKTRRERIQRRAVWSTAPAARCK